MMLVDKYRPTDLKDIIGNKDTISTLQSVTTSRNPPHLLFTGTPGTGKTTCAKIIAATLSNTILELNASDERGIDVVRTKIKSFSSQLSDTIKIIILDEADSMTQAAQQAMRRVMELNSSQTRFILICNSFVKIFEPIQSRCAIFRFERLSADEIAAQLKVICGKENIVVNDDAIDAIVRLSDGDMRQAINILQSVQFNMQADEIEKIVGVPSPRAVEKIMILLKNGNFNAALSIFNTIWDEKYDPVDIIGAFFRVAKNNDDYGVLTAVAKSQLRIADGCNSKIQFYALFSEIIDLESNRI